MTKEELEYLKNTPYLMQYLMEESSSYRYLYLKKNYLKEIEKLAKEKYGLTIFAKIEKVLDKIQLIETILNVLE